ncbi:hypothetical protein D3C87_1436010 [compost metagenome]
MDFVQKLFLYRTGVHRAAGGVSLADDEFAVGINLCNGKARRMHVGHLFQARHAEVAPRDLQAAFQHVAGHGGAPQAGPVCRVPAEVSQCRTQRERWVGHAARHHHLRAGRQGLCDFRGAQIGRRADDVVSGQRGAQAFLQQGALLGRVQRVAVDDRNARHGQALFARDCRNASGGGLGVGRAEVADDVDAVAQAVGQDRRYQLVQQRFIAAIGVVVARQLRERQRAFGKRFEDKRAAALGGQGAHHGGSAIASVARKARGAADKQGRLRHERSSRPCGFRPL